MVYTWIYVLLISLAWSSAETSDNTVKGTVEMADCSSSVKRGHGYNKDGTEIMHSSDAMARPENNVIVSLHPLNFEPTLVLTEDAYITQYEQTFLPHTMPVVVGSKVHFLNEDEFFHNVQSYTPRSRFSIGRRAPGVAYSVDIDKIGVIDLKCDIHPHMEARILSFDTPYFVRVAEDGSYELTGIPDGQYRIEVNHPYCRKIIKSIDLVEGDVHVHDFSFVTKP